MPSLLEQVQPSWLTDGFGIEGQQTDINFDDDSAWDTTAWSRNEQNQEDFITKCCKGACCFDDGSCVEESRSACETAGGHYQGDGTTCAGTDCTGGGTGTSGACCVGSNCSITTPRGCADAGGTYQGDNSTCDPNPCPIPSVCCTESFGYPAFDGSGRRFLRYHRTITANQTLHEVQDCPDPDGFTYDVVEHDSETYEEHYDPVTCERIVDTDVVSSDRTETLNGTVIVDCSSSVHISSCFCIPPHVTDTDGSPLCNNLTNFCHGCSTLPPASDSSTTTATTRTRSIDFTNHCSVITTACAGGHHDTCDSSGSATVVETLSDECILI